MMNLWKWRANWKGPKHPAGGPGTNPLKILKGDSIRLLKVVAQLTGALKHFFPSFCFILDNKYCYVFKFTFSSAVSNLPLIFSIAFYVFDIVVFISRSLVWVF